MLARFALGLFTMFLALTAAAASLEDLEKNQMIHGFRTDALYVDDAGKPFGARFIHNDTGFIFDYLRIESVPQGYTWVNSVPVGDQGEPHTQEHLLLGKGTTGRAFSGLDTMWLSRSTAFTQQWRTSYHFNTAAGKDVFFDLFAAELNALLHPNYTDEEIRREVRHFGVTTAADGSLRLEEKGSVYNEMTSSSANRYRVLFRSMGHLLYGTQHPLAYNSGGEPAGIRTMQPEDIRAFHAANYALGNMGTMAAFPSSVSLDEALTRTAAILDEVKSETPRKFDPPSFPEPSSAAAGTIAIGEFPNRNEQQPSPLAFAWPPTRQLSPREYLLADLFADTFAGDATTNLYKLFVDSKSRVMETGATGVFNQVSEDQGNPVAFFLIDLAPANLTRDKMAEIRAIVMAELARIAALPDDSPELKEFNQRLLSRVTETERDLANLVNTPPGWGARGTGSTWLDQLSLLADVDGFRKSVTLQPQLAAIRREVTSGGNIWSERLKSWGLTEVVPYAVAARPSPALLEREDQERIARADAEAQRLAKVYGLSDTQEALRRYAAEYEAESARIEAEAANVEPPPFIESPPMGLDPLIQYTQTKTAGVPLVASTFDNMSSATLGLLLDARGVSPNQLRYLSLFPALLTRVGVIEDGEPVSFEEMSERLRNEILRLDANFSTNVRTGRVELAVRGSGIGVAESKRAIDWIDLVVNHPDWRPENLPRIRDVVDQSLSSLRNMTQRSEESWVNDPANAFRLQSNPVFLAADSFQTGTHNALRLRWLLREAPAADRDALMAYFGELATAANERSREELKTFLSEPLPSSLSASAQAIVDDARKDLDLTLGDIPDGSLKADWAYLVTAIRDDLMTPPQAALSDLESLREALTHRDIARMFLVGSSATQKALASDVEALAGSLDEEPAPRNVHADAPHITLRLRDRAPEAKNPQYVGLLAPNMKGGVIITAAPGVQYSDVNDTQKQLDYLASRLHAGAGAHGIFLKTLAAGLAYSNGLRGSISSGVMGYYAERTPEIPQTVGFVVDTLKNAELDPRLGDYVVAQILGDSRAAASYEARAAGIADDLVDGQSPQVVRSFRQSILALREDPELAKKLFDRKDEVYARLLPGYTKGAPSAAIYFAIGPDKQLNAWEQYLDRTEGETATFYRLYPRDFWMP